MRKKILFVLPALPWPLISGGHQALYNGIYAIKDDYDIFVAYVLDNRNGEAEKHFRNVFPGIVLLPVSFPKLTFCQNLARWSHIIIRKIFAETEKPEEQICERWIKTILPLREELVSHIDKICREYNFDIIQVEMPWFVSLVLTLPSTAKKIYVHHELGFVRRELEKEKLPRNAYVDTCKSFVDVNEISLLNLYDRVITLSSIDSEKLRNKGVLVPVSTSFAIVNSASEPQINICDGNVLTFVGPDSHLPNFVGITWFCENCWGKLKSMNPNYRLKIIGKWSKSHIQQFKAKYPDVEFLGFVDDIKMHLVGSIMIVPITIGSGIRMKVLEASSLGVPFVSTHVGAEGIPVSNGEDCFLADTPEAFVESIIKLKDIEIQKTFVNNARRMVQETFSLDAFRKNRIGIYESI